MVNLENLINWTSFTCLIFFSLGRSNKFIPGLLFPTENPKVGKKRKSIKDRKRFRKEKKL